MTATIIQSLRNVGSKKGYPYFAFGVYEPKARTRDGVVTYRLVRSGPWVRSDKNARTSFDGIPIVRNVRHGSPVIEVARV